MKTRLISILLVLFSYFLSCKKENIEQTPNTPPITTNPNGTLPSLGKSQQAIITSLKTPVGVVSYYEDAKLQTVVSGLKSKDGNLISVEKIVLINTTNNAWARFEMNADFLPQKALTSTGYIVEFSNYQVAASTVDIIVKRENGQQIAQKKGNQVNPQVFLLAQQAKTYIKDGVDYTKAKVAACDKFVGGLAAGVYIGQSIVGCVIGFTTFLASIETGPFAAIVAGRAAYSACNDLKDLVQNIQNNRAAIQCPESGAAERDCFTNIITETGEAMNNCVKTVANTWVTRKACECNSELQSRGILDDVGTSHGDPHITTLDGLYYSFQGHGEFTAVKSTTDNFLVQARQEPYSPTEKRVSINTGVAIRSGTDVVNVFTEPFKLYLNNKLQTADFVATRLTDKTLVTKTTDEVRILTPTEDEIIVNTKRHLAYVINLNQNRKGKVQGIFGNFNGNSKDDLLLANGSVLGSTGFKDLYPNFVDAWRIKQAESLFFYEAGKNTDSYSNKNFPNLEFTFSLTELNKAEQTCRNAGLNREPYLSRCMYDVGVTNDATFAESAFWTQSFASFSSVPIADNINYFQNVRIEVGATQAQMGIKNLIDFDLGKTFTFAEGINNANIDALTYPSVGVSNELATFALIKTCGNSCGTSLMNTTLKNLNWVNYPTGQILLADGTDQNLKIKISTIDFYNIQNAADITKSITTKLKSDEPFLNSTASLENFKVGLNKQNVFVFITKAGKQGIFRIVGSGVNPVTKVSYYDLDIKIQK